MRSTTAGVLRAEPARGPVVSIGNLCVGGTGKTPFTQVLGDLLMARGIAFDVLSRGYGRSSTEIAVVDPKGCPRQIWRRAAAARELFRGEMEQAKNRTRRKSVVGPDRYEAGRFAERTFGPRIHLLDDGFQHRRLARDFDVVCLRRTMLNRCCCRLADCGSPSVAAAGGCGSGSRRRKLAAFPSLPQRIWHIERDIVLPAGFRKEQRTLAFCGIARPNRFFQRLATSWGVSGFNRHVSRSSRLHGAGCREDPPGNGKQPCRMLHNDHQRHDEPRTAGCRPGPVRLGCLTRHEPARWRERSR